MNDLDAAERLLDLIAPRVVIYDGPPDWPPHRVIPSGVIGRCCTCHSWWFGGVNVLYAHEREFPDHDIWIWVDDPRHPSAVADFEDHPF